MKFLVCAYVSAFMAPDLKQVFDDFDSAHKKFKEAEKDYAENRWSHRSPPEMFAVQKIDPESYRVAKTGSIT